MPPVTDVSARISAALNQLPAVAVDSQAVVSGLGGVDLVVAASVCGHRVGLVVEVKPFGYPRDVAVAIHQLRSYLEAQADPDAVPLIYAPRLSPTSRAILREQGIGYLDDDGNVFLRLPWACYWIDKPAKDQPDRGPGQRLFSGRAAQVTHALLLDAHRSWHLDDLAVRANVAPGTAYKVCRAMEDRQWMQRSGRGPATTRLLLEPGAMLDAWVTTHSLGRYQARHYHGWAQNRHELLRHLASALDSADVDYALTLSTGAQLVAPHLSLNDHSWVLIPQIQAETADRVATDQKLHRVEQGGVITLLISNQNSATMFRSREAAVWVASPVQLYLDLMVWPQRGKEQAQHLRAERLPF